MVNNGRVIKVNKQQLIETIKKNKQLHIKEYKQAVIAFKKEALKQIAKLEKAVKAGNTEGIRLDLTTPQYRARDYDKLVLMFTWDLEKEVELSQGEFNQYIHDEFDFAIAAKMSNTYYSNSKSKGF